MIIFARVYFVLLFRLFSGRDDFFSPYFLFNCGLGASVHWYEGVFILHYTPGLVPIFFYRKVLFILQFATFGLFWGRNMCSP
ncbi:hypothetical protein DFP73DRAFT_401620 [Morchella snyderi]|nr:hypothetical protein DFP73DRAFT_401620 [Morchella snyderi]